MDQIRVDELLERGDELVPAFGRQVEAEELDCNRSLPRRVISPEYRAERPCTNLMKNTKWSERVGNGRAVSFRLQ